jgi:hypothetical protein
MTAVLTGGSRNIHYLSDWIAEFYVAETEAEAAAPTNAAPKDAKGQRHRAVSPDQALI